jgi:hypothetical protein
MFNTAIIIVRNINDDDYDDNNNTGCFTRYWPQSFSYNF